LLKQKHKILNLDDVEDGNLINTSDEDKTTDEEEKAHSITAIWHFEKQNDYLKASVFLYIFAPAGTIAFNQHDCPVTHKIIFVHVNWAVFKKFDTGFAQIFAFGNSIYLFSLYLRFKSLYRFLGRKLYDLPLNL
jgi:hypothetical protein